MFKFILVVRNNLKIMELSYVNVRRKFDLTHKAKMKRLEISKQFLIGGIKWNNVVFTDEKLFTLNGCDSYHCWMRDGRSPRRVKNILKASGLMIWAMILPNGLVSFEVMKGKVNSEKYINIIKSKAIPIININYQRQMTWQHDNCPTHVSRLTKNYLESTGLIVLNWPPYSPDLNIIENVWYLLSRYVYDGPQIKNLKMLEQKITMAVTNFNEKNCNIVDNLYKSMPSRLVSIICKRGERINY